MALTERHHIRVEKATSITNMDERAVLAAAFAAKPGSLVVRRKLAFQGMMADAFDEVIDLLSAIPLQEREFDDQLMIAEAYLSREGREGACLARDAAHLAFTMGGDRQQRAAALADLGKAEVRLEEFARAASTFEAALELDPLNKNACKRLAALHLKAGRSQVLLSLVEKLEKRGARHSRALAARTLALVQSGDIEAARQSLNLAQFMHRQQLPTPQGWPSLAAFNEALAQELMSHPGLTYDRYGTASEYTWRIDQPLAGDRPLVRTLVAELSSLVESHIARLAASDHAWTVARPKSGTFHSWCVITESAGFETWHVHQFGWMSGVYYVQVPESIVEGSGEGGCLAFGVPEGEVGERAAEAFGREVIRPRAGSVLLFPSHAYHRTFPHGLAERRICLAFDIWPE